MQTERIEIDSQIWGRSVLCILSFNTADDFHRSEADYIARHAPAYVYSSVELSDVPRIEYLSHAGFSPVDCQLLLKTSFRRRFDTSTYGLSYHQVVTQTQLDEVLSIAAQLDFNDRFSRDPAVPSGFAAQRYLAYLRQSFAADSDEIWSVCDPGTGRLLTFRSHRHVGKGEVQLLLGGVRKELHGEGLGAISTHFCFDQMAAAGIRRANTRISMTNKPVFDLEVTHFGFRYQSASLILRKCYPSPPTGELT
ncbi:MAG: hypothetical protein ACKO2L_03820 [Planctomycetaceae bacterium]